jgi:hypothetical protein
VELGYDYCLKPECQQRCMKKVMLAAVAVNKAADYYTKADEVVSPVAAPAVAAIEADDVATRPSHRRAPATPRRVKSTLERLREEEAGLDVELDRCYQRFCRGEITATELDRQRARLIGAFNQLVKSENIRYRSLLRAAPKNFA